ncbi:MAG TPA: universal stress protein [Thermoanaerobaculia bacterium]|jgi:nucleotide-binding universal stress UspA family protein|nr:universal stress protein [Thermoanaerobaculia bacterium]
MSDFQRILVPTDLSDFSKAAARWAAMFHRRFGSRITLLYANEPYAPFDVLEGPAAYALQSAPEFRQRLAEELTTFAGECFPDCGSSVDTLMVDAAPAQAIVDTAEKIDADVILMGTHGRRGWRRALLGSVTENVLRATDRPLMSVPASFATPAGPKIAKIVCPVNFTDIARQALEEAVVLAAAFDAELLVVHVADLVDCLTHDEEDFAAWVEPGVRKRCRYSQIAARGDAAEQVLKIAEQAGADLIVIGAQHKRFSDATVIGTTTERVVRFARQPVWTVVSHAEARSHQDEGGSHAHETDSRCPVAADTR